MEATTADGCSIPQASITDFSSIPFDSRSRVFFPPSMEATTADGSSIPYASIYRVSFLHRWRRPPPTVPLPCTLPSPSGGATTSTAPRLTGQSLVDPDIEAQDWPFHLTRGLDEFNPFFRHLPEFKF